MLQTLPLPDIWKLGLTVLLGGATLAGIMTRPFRWNEATVAMCGAALLVLLGLVSPGAALRTLLREWNVFLFFLGMMTLSALAEAAGLFDWLAVQAARRAGGSVRRLYFNLFLLGAAIVLFLSNDAAALILTPVVYLLVTRLRLPVLPFLFACTFIADTASFLLPISNPINIILLSRYPLGLGAYLHYLLPPALVVIVLNIGVFILIFRRQLVGTYQPGRLPSLDETIRCRPYFRFTCAVLAVVAVAYVLATALGWPLSLVSLGGAALLLGGALHWKQSSLAAVSRNLSWSLFGFIAGMFVVVRAVEGTGLMARFGAWLLRLSGGTHLGSVLVGAFGSGLGTNLINNVPMAVVMNSALAGIHGAPPDIQRSFVLATLLGCDLGPNLTIVGSLATILWLLILRRRGVEVTGLDYFKVGVVITPLMLLAGALTLWALI
jgi:arsenical pump membrane protein